MRTARWMRALLARLFALLSTTGGSGEAAAAAAAAGVVDATPRFRTSLIQVGEGPGSPRVAGPTHRSTHTPKCGQCH